MQTPARRLEFAFSEHVLEQEREGFLAELREHYGASSEDGSSDLVVVEVPEKHLPALQTFLHHEEKQGTLRFHLSEYAGPEACC